MTHDVDHIPSFAEFLMLEGEGGAAGGVVGGDAGGAAIGGDASVSSGGEAFSGGDALFMHGGEPITTPDVLGKCDHHKDGCMGPNCFHLPHVFPMAYRWPCCYGGSKKKHKKGKKDPKVKVITTYALLTEDLKSNLSTILVHDIPFSLIESILNSTSIENARFNKSLFMKYNDGSNDKEVVALYAEQPRECMAMAILEFNQASKNDCYVCEIQAFKKGYGKDLLLKLLKHLKHLWLLASPEGGEKLVKYYRDPAFGFEEVTVEDSVFDSPAHFFYKPSSVDNELVQHIIETYSKEVNEDEDTSNSQKVKIWIDDVRPTPNGYLSIKSVDDFIDWFNLHSAEEIDVLDMDHDAGDYLKDGGDYIRILDFLEFNGVKDLNVRIHSDNPVGRQNMQRIIKKNGWKEVFNLIQEGAAPEVKTISLKLPKVVCQDKVIATLLKSKESKMASRSTHTAKENEKILKPKLKLKAILFPREEITDEFKKRDTIVTTRVDSDFDKFLIGDLLKAPWGNLYKVIARRCISDVIQHPWFRELTDKQVQKLREYDKIAVLLLSKQQPLNEDEQKDIVFAMNTFNKVVNASLPNAVKMQMTLEVHPYDEIKSVFRFPDTEVFDSTHNWYLLAVLSKQFLEFANRRALMFAMEDLLKDMIKKHVVNRARDAFKASDAMEVAIDNNAKSEEYCIGNDDDKQLALLMRVEAKVK